MADDEKMIEITRETQVPHMIQGICEIVNRIKIGDSVSWEISRPAVVDEKKSEELKGSYHKPGRDTYLYLHIKRKGE